MAGSYWKYRGKFILSASDPPHSPIGVKIKPVSPTALTACIHPRTPFPRAFGDRAAPRASDKPAKCFPGAAFHRRNVGGDRGTKRMARCLLGPGKQI